MGFLRTPQNLHRTFDKNVLVKKLTKILFKRCGQVVLFFFDLTTFYRIWQRNLKNFVGFLEYRLNHTTISFWDLLTLMSPISVYTLVVWISNLKSRSWTDSKIHSQIWSWNPSVRVMGLACLHGLRTPSEGKNQRNLKIWANAADKVCFGCT